MRHLRWQVRLVNGLVIGGMLLGWTHSALAQRRPIADETLGSEGSIVTPQDDIRGVPGDRIEGGAQRGNNLFHSFREFNVDAGRAVYFADPGVQNILGRVTGGNQSEILGRLGVLGNANLFLINPSGIVFGDNARLDVGGSFVATTADAMQFGEQGFFSATDPAAAPLLTVQPSAFLFNRLNPAPIANNSSAPAAENPSGLPEFGLKVPGGESLTLLGGNVSLDGGGLVALGGRVEVGGLSQPGTVTLNTDRSLGFPTRVARSDVSLSNGSRINVVGDSGGSITVNAGALEIVDSILLAGIASNSGFVGAQAGDVTLNASDIRVRDTAGIGNLVRVGGVGTGGDIRITTGSLSLTNAAQLDASTRGRGDAGDVIITAHDRVSLNGADSPDSSSRSAILSRVGNVNSDVIAVGNGGDIRITTGSLSLTNAAQLEASTFGRGDAGDVIITAHDRVSLNGADSPDSSSRSAILSSVGNVNSDAIAVGNGGDICITTGSLSLTNGAQLVANTFGQGDAGDVIIHARDRVSLNGADSPDSRFFSLISSSVGASNVNTVAVGTGGDIRITTGSLSLTNGAQLVANTFGQGRAGDVIITARDRVSLDNSAIFSSVGATNANTVAVGKGGDIRITTGTLSLTNDAQLAAATLGQGNSGNVIIHARDRVSLDNSNIFSSVGAFNVNTVAVGKGGDIRITTGTLSLTNGAQLNAATLGQGRAGDIRITADTVSLEGVSNDGRSSGLFTTTVSGAQGQGGSITIDANSVRLSDGAVVNAQTFNRFPGGDVTLNADMFEVTGGGQFVTTTSGSGKAGNITLNVSDRITLSGFDPNYADRRRQFGGDRVSNQGESSGLFANTADRSSGQGGTIRLTTGELEVSDRAGVIVSSQGRGVAGDINLSAQSVQLDQGSLSAATKATDGGNITLRDTDLLLLRHGSNISTNAGTQRAGGNGGNIDINADFIVAAPNDTSDISANAFTGSGGKVRIDSQGVFGIAAQPLDNPLTSDITASSAQGVQGTVEITTPNTDPRRGLIELPVAVLDASDQVAQTCAAQAGTGEFVVSGRGGLPPSPIDSLIGDESLADWAVLERTEVKDGEATSAIAPPPQADSAAAGAIVEAQGWVVGEDGNVRLIAAAPASSIQPPAICQSSENQ